jgi:NADH-ubiquinone oxidoreductase chain 5
MLNLYNRPIYLSAIVLLWRLLGIMLIPTISIVFSQQIFIIEWNLISVFSTPIVLTLVADPLGLIFSCVVLFISSNVLIFSTVYMHDDTFINRFTVLVLLFILSINLLIFLPHFIILLLGWDGLGIVSFILVVYYQNPKSLAAGIITALTNRIGDVILLLSIAWTINQGHWFIINMWESPISAIQVLRITVAAITKRAQIPFSSWLPAAMAAPTPVSALVHSSTLVTAGVFLLIRFYPFLHSIKIFNTVILIIAVCTILIAGLRATTECDIKKIIALSTLSQLGIIITRIGLNAPRLAFFHMLTHALFKALLFICAGSFINCHLHTQDLRWMGNLTAQIPVATSCISIANLALCGFPFIAGFYSKDLIIESAINNPNNSLIVMLALIRVGLTSFYSIRFSLVTMWSSNSRPRMINVTEKYMVIVPMLALSTLSITSGRIMSLISPIRNSLYILPTYIKIAPLVIVTIGLIVGWLITTNTTPKKSALISSPYNHWASCTIWYLTPLSSQFIIKAPLVSSHHLIKSIDQGWLEVMSGQGTHSQVIFINNSLISLIPKSPTAYLVTASTRSIILIITLIINI